MLYYLSSFASLVFLINVIILLAFQKQTVVLASPRTTKASFVAISQHHTHLGTTNNNNNGWTRSSSSSVTILQRQQQQQYPKKKNEEDVGLQLLLSSSSSQSSRQQNCFDRKSWKPLRTSFFPVLSTTAQYCLRRRRRGQLVVRSMTEKNTADNNNDDDTTIKKKYTVVTPSSNSTKAQKDTSKIPAVEMFENVVRSVTHNEDYQFGDITKNVTKKTLDDVKATTETVVRKVMNDEEYEFGDITKGIIRDVGSQTMEETIETMDLPVQLETFLRQLNLTPPQKRMLLLQILQCCALAVLSLNFVFNALTSVNIWIAWALTIYSSLAAATGILPSQGFLVFGVQPSFNNVFLATYSSLKIYFSPIVMPIGCAAAYFALFPYWRLVKWTQTKVLFRKQYYDGDITKNNNIVHRIVSMLVVFFLCNIVALSSMTGIGVWIMNALSGIGNEDFGAMSMPLPILQLFFAAEYR